MKNILLILVTALLLISFGVLSAEERVFTESDLEKYHKSPPINNRPASARDDYLREREDYSKKLRKESTELDARIDKLKQEARDRDEKRNIQKKDIESYPAQALNLAKTQHYKPLINTHFRSTLKDPDSLKIYSLVGTVRGPYSVFSVDYGAKNSYGGYIRSFTVLTYKEDELVRTD